MKKAIEEIEHCQRTMIFVTLVDISYIEKIQMKGSFMMGNAMWHLVTQSDAVSKGVLFMLLGMSMICWTIFMYKLIIFRVKLNQLNNAVTKLSSIKSFIQLTEQLAAWHTTMPGYFLTKNIHMLKSLLIHEQLPTDQVNQLEQHVNQTIDDVLHTEEQHIPFLSVCASVAPLLGLFGTVWGLVHAFIRISEQQSADIATVAPGIAEALITTLAGLMVAIPAVTMFALLSSYIKNIEKQLVKLADVFMHLAQQYYRTPSLHAVQQSSHATQLAE